MSMAETEETSAKQGVRGYSSLRSKLDRRPQWG